MTEYKRDRTKSEYEEKNVQEFIDATVDFDCGISFLPAPAASEDIASHLLLVGTEAQLAETEKLAALPFWSEAVEYAVYVLNEFCRGRCKDELGLLVPTCACYNLRAFALHMDQLGEKRVMLAFAHHRAVELVVELMHGKRAQVSWVREGEETRRVAARTGSVF